MNVGNSNVAPIGSRVDGDALSTGIENDTGRRRQVGPIGRSLIAKQSDLVQIDTEIRLHWLTRHHDRFDMDDDNSREL